MDPASEVDSSASKRSSVTTVIGKSNNKPGKRDSIPPPATYARSAGNHHHARSSTVVTAGIVTPQSYSSRDSIPPQQQTNDDGTATDADGEESTPMSVTTLTPFFPRLPDDGSPLVWSPGSTTLPPPPPPPKQSPGAPPEKSSPGDASPPVPATQAVEEAAPTALPHVQVADDPVTITAADVAEVAARQQPPPPSSPPRPKPPPPAGPPLALNPSPPLLQQNQQQKEPLPTPTPAPRHVVSRQPMGMEPTASAHGRYHGKGDVESGCAPADDDCCATAPGCETCKEDCDGFWACPPTTSQKPCQPPKTQSDLRILIVRVVIAIVLFGLAIGLGAASFILLRSIELTNFQNEFNSATSQIQTTVQTSLNNKFVAYDLTNNIYRYGIRAGGMGKLPNVTLSGFENIMNAICQLSNSRAISWSPLVQPNTRAAWTAYAQSNLGLVTATNLTDAQKKIVNWKIGAYNKSSGASVPVKPVISGTPAPYNTWLFPVWQMAPIAPNYKAIFLEPHSFVGTRKEIIDLGLLTGKGGFTDILQLVQDSSPRPSSTLYYPMTDLNNNVIGLFAGIFSWDTLFQSALPSYLNRVDCVLTSTTTTYTIAVDQGNVYIVDKSDKHDPNFSQYGKSFNPSTSAYPSSAVTRFTVTVYPSAAFYNQYVTSVPVTVCAVLVCIIVATMLIVVLYDFFVRKREVTLHSKAEEAEETTKLVASLLPSNLQKNTADDLKAIGERLKVQLATHPVHRAILDGEADEAVLALLADEEHRKSTVKKIEGKTAFDFAIQRDDGAAAVAAAAGGSSDGLRPLGTPLVTALLTASLPVDTETKLPLLPVEHGFTWLKAVQHDRYEPSVAAVLHAFPLLASELAAAADAEGRTAVHIASPKVKKTMLKFIHFFKRYEMRSLSRAYHTSATCQLHLAVDHDDEMRPVALKFMKHRDQFAREIRVRSQGRLDGEHVVSLLRHHDPDDDAAFAEELRRKGLDAYPYLIVMDQGERNLNDVLSKENITGNLEAVRVISAQIARCVAHMHERGYVHGDIKPLNCMRMGHGFKLIDLDASCRYDGRCEEFACAKFSSGYVPPECIYVGDGVVCVRSSLCRHVVRSAAGHNVFFEANRSTRGGGGDAGDGRIDDEDDDDDDDDEVLTFDLVPADSSLDMWAFGCLLYHLVARSSLFNCDHAGNVASDSDLRVLAEWSDAVKLEKLSHIGDKYAKNLVSQLLTKDPAKRPSAAQVLAHPFLSGKMATRLEGEQADYDVFISYRYNSDLHVAQALYDALVAKGVNVWWDQRCLQPGEPWEEGFCKGLIKSATFLPIFSRGAINDPSNPRQNFGALRHDSPCDNCLLEQRLALELKERGLVEKIYPLFVGRTHPDGAYERYVLVGDDADHPQLPTEPVAAVEQCVIGHLDAQGLGLPYQMNMPVAAVVNSVLRFQGSFVQGDLAQSLETHIVPAVLRMLPVRRDSAGRRTRRAGAPRSRTGSLASSADSSVVHPDDFPHTLVPLSSRPEAAAAATASSNAGGAASPAATAARSPGSGAAAPTTGARAAAAAGTAGADDLVEFHAVHADTPSSAGFTGTNPSVHVHHHHSRSSVLNALAVDDEDEPTPPSPPPPPPQLPLPQGQRK